MLQYYETAESVYRENIAIYGTANTFFTAMLGDNWPCHSSGS